MAEAVQALIALAGDTTGVATFVADGMWTPPATLRAMGRPEMAQAAVSSFRGRSHQWVRLYMQEGNEEEWRVAAEIMDADVDWPYLGKLAPSFMALDLFEERPRVDIPTLYLNPAVELIGLEGMTDAFKRFAPNAETDELRLWPGRMQDPRSGHEFANRVIRFLDKERVVN